MSQQVRKAQGQLGEPDREVTKLRLWPAAAYVQDYYVSERTALRLSVHANRTYRIQCNKAHLAVSSEHRKSDFDDIDYEMLNSQAAEAE